MVWTHSILNRFTPPKGPIRQLSGGASYYDVNYDGSDGGDGGYTTLVPPNASFMFWEGQPIGGDNTLIPTLVYSTWNNGWLEALGGVYVQGNFLDNRIGYPTSPNPAYIGKWDSGLQTIVAKCRVLEALINPVAYSGGPASLYYDGSSLFITNSNGGVSTYDGSPGVPPSVASIRPTAAHSYALYTTTGHYLPYAGPYSLGFDYSGSGGGFEGVIFGLFNHNGGFWALAQGRWYYSNNAPHGPSLPAYAIFQCVGGDPTNYNDWSICQTVFSPLDLATPPGGSFGYAGLIPCSGAWPTLTGTYILAGFGPGQHDSTHIYLFDNSNILSTSRTTLVDEDACGSIVDLDGDLYTVTHVSGTHHIRLYRLTAGVWGLVSTGNPPPNPSFPSYHASEAHFALGYGGPLYATHGKIHMPAQDKNNVAVIWDRLSNSWTAEYRTSGVFSTDGLTVGRIWPNDAFAP